MTKRGIDLLTEAYGDVMSKRRKYELETPNGSKIDLYFPPLTRYDRQKAQKAANTDDALVVSTQLLCQMAEKEDVLNSFLWPTSPTYKDYCRKKF